MNIRQILANPTFSAEILRRYISFDLFRLGPRGRGFYVKTPHILYRPPVLSHTITHNHLPHHPSPPHITLYPWYVTHPLSYLGIVPVVITLSPGVIVQVTTLFGNSSHSYVTSVFVVITTGLLPPVGDLVISQFAPFHCTT